MKKDKMLIKSSNRDVQEFLKKVARTPINKALKQKGRVIFSMDATASRQPSWDHACNIQGEMFNATAADGSLEIQLCYYRGFGEFYGSPWTKNSHELLNLMTAVNCRAGETQIKKILDHTRRETQKLPVDALIFIGDSIEEDLDHLGNIAGQLGLLGVPAFIFQEGEDNLAEFAFREIAKLTNGQLRATQWVVV